jgi:hypothetical protein
MLYVRSRSPIAAVLASLPLALLALPRPAAAVERNARNAVYAEGLGAGLAYSLNYERLVVDDLAVRVGASYLSVSASASAGGQSSMASSSWMTFPSRQLHRGGLGQARPRAGRRRHPRLRLGSASTIGASASGSGTSAMGNLMVGYRLQPVDGGFQFRVGLAALVGQGLGLDVKDPTKVGVLPWFYISFRRRLLSRAVRRATASAGGCKARQRSPRAGATRRS